MKRVLNTLPIGSIVRYQNVWGVVTKSATDHARCVDTWENGREFWPKTAVVEVKVGP